MARCVISLHRTGNGAIGLGGQTAVCGADNIRRPT